MSAEVTPNGESLSNAKTKGNFDKFTEHHFKNLPSVMRYGLDSYSEPHEREIFFLGMLTVVSGLLPNVQFDYDKKRVDVNLLIYVLANYGQGKGRFLDARKLGEGVHKMKREKYFREKENEEAKSKQPKYVKNKRLFIPANTSKAGLSILLNDNGGRGIMLVSEVDTLTTQINSQHGGFSDILRTAFHNEPLEDFKVSAESKRDIDTPRNCLVGGLTSTFNQLPKLISSVENGLFSRFGFYLLKDTKSFINVFDRSKNHSERLDKLQDLFSIIYTSLDSFQNINQIIVVRLSEDQEQKFLKWFGEKKSELEEIDTRLNGMANRLGVMAHKIMSIFTILRQAEVHQVFEGKIQKSLDQDYKKLASKILYCSETDFINTLSIMEVFLFNGLRVYNGLPKNKQFKGAAQIPIIDQQTAFILKLKGQGKSYGAISKIMNMPRSTVSSKYLRYLKTLSQE